MDILLFNISDIIRSNVKFKQTPEKEIDEYIATWLSHAKFRLLKKSKKVSLEDAALE